MLEDGSMVGRPLPTLDVETLEALVRAAHQRELLAVAHVTTYEQAGHAVAAGVDGLVHLFRDRAASAEWIARVSRDGLFVVPTLTVLENTTGVASGAALPDDPRLADYLTAAEISGLRQQFPPSDATLEAATATLRALVADFESGELTAAFGSGWTESTDGMMGGQSTVALEIAADGANGTAHALVIAGEIRSGFAFPWAGAMFFPGSVPMTPANLSAAKELVFWARGTAGSYRVLAFAESLGQRPTEQAFEVNGNWRQVVLSMDAFSGADAAGLTGLLWSAGATEGPFRLEIDEIELR